MSILGRKGKDMWKQWILAWIVFTSFLPSFTSNNSKVAPSNRMVNSTHRSSYDTGQLTDMPLEMTISRRMSIRAIDPSNPVPWELVSEVLWAASGYSGQGRTTPTLGGHPVIIYVCNGTAAYKFVPENQSLAVWKEGDYRTFGGELQFYPAPIQLYIALDTDICQDVYWGVVELGCAVQSIYLMANSLNLGTVCQGRWMDRHIHEMLGLPPNQDIFIKMPLGYPMPPCVDYQNLVPTSHPSSAELLEIKDSSMTLKEALDSVFSSHEWSENPLTEQELSQILWSSYGFSYYEDTATTPRKRHRTVPSAAAYYPMKIYVADSLGVHQYIPEQHTLALVDAEDKRPNIAQASGNQWASSAPIIVVIAWDESRIESVGANYIEAGLIAQNVFLESAAWGLIADWGRADKDERAMRESLGLTGAANLHPVSIIALGHPSITATTTTVITPTLTTTITTTTTVPTTLTSITTSISTSPTSTATVITTATETKSVTSTTTVTTTHATTALPPTFWMEWWFWAIVGVCPVLVVIGAVWKLRRGPRKQT